MEIVEAHVGKMESQLRQWGAKLDEIFAKTRETGTVNYRNRLNFLRTKYQAAQARLEEFRTSGNENREICKTGVESAWNELKAAFKKLTN